MEGEGDDGCQVDIDEDCQPRASKKLKKDDNLDLEVVDEGGPSHEDIDIEDKNPFQDKDILDIIFKMLPFEDVKKFRLVSSTWNEVGTSELSKRPQKPIKFYWRGNFHDDDQGKLDALLQLQRRHKKVFPGDILHLQLYTNFYINTSFLKILQLDQFFQNFSPKCVKIFGDQNDRGARKFLCKFLIKLAPTIQEISYYFFRRYYECESEEEEEDYVQELTSTTFPNLIIISYKYCTSDMKDLFFYSLIGQNSPKLRQLELGPNAEDLGSAEYMQDKFEQCDLLSKLTILDLTDCDEYKDKDIIKRFTVFGQNGTLRLKKLIIQQDNCRRAEEIQIYAPLIATQTETLKFLEISISFNALGSPINITKIPFPSLQNLAILHIDNFSAFELCFEPINFSIQFPKLVEFRTRDIETFLDKKLGQGESGGSVKSVSILTGVRKEPDRGIINGWTAWDHKSRLDLAKVYQIFPNLEFLEMEVFNFLPKLENPFPSQLKKVVIHCELLDLSYFEGEDLKGVQNVEIFVDCENKLVYEDSYKDYLGGLMTDSEGDDNSGYYNRNKYYQSYLSMISELYASLHNSVSITFVGHKISEDFKRDFRAIFPNCAFVCTPFKSAHEDENCELSNANLTD